MTLMGFEPTTSRPQHDAAKATTDMIFVNDSSVLEPPGSVTDESVLEPHLFEWEFPIQRWISQLQEKRRLNLNMGRRYLHNITYVPSEYSRSDPEQAAVA
ncbi:hypothetical protein V1264_015753 [Littorina saxatilis]|uniref:Uncharacterized protein n=1 Tax=Littorina saxatilis TaxID=31220 RepID=A0AAN9GGU0_9CAEN